jgi:hypothetical protein
MFQHFSSRDLLAYFQNMVRQQRSSFVAAGLGLLFLVIFTIVPSATKENEQSLGHSKSFREFQV